MILQSLQTDEPVLYFFGLCSILENLYWADLITKDEYDSINHILHNHFVEKYNIEPSTWWWHPDDDQSRINFISELITEYSKEE